MPLQIINSFATWILKKRIHQMELFLKYPHEVQEELLFSLMKSAEATQIGKKYDFTSTELRDLKPRYNNKSDGLERDNQLYLEEENKLFHAAIITMTTLLFASIYISSNR
jgi:hypothetical protein